MGNRRVALHPWPPRFGCPANVASQFAQFGAFGIAQSFGHLVHRPALLVAPGSGARARPHRRRHRWMRSGQPTGLEPDTTPRSPDRTPDSAIRRVRPRREENWDAHHPSTPTRTPPHGLRTESARGAAWPIFPVPPTTPRPVIRRRPHRSPGGKPHSSRIYFAAASFRLSALGNNCRWVNHPATASPAQSTVLVTC